MIIYYDTVANFKREVLYGEIADKIEQNFLEHGFHHNNPAEYRAFANSFNNVRNVLEIANLDNDVKVAIEYQLPISSKRIDFMITGKDAQGKDSAIIVELKQWDSVKLTDGDDVITYVAHAERVLPHPSYQAYTYASIIENFNEDVRNKGVGLYPCSYVHNFPGRGVDVSLLTGEKFANILELAPCFTKGGNQAMADFIKQRIVYPDDGSIVEMIDHGKLAPSKTVQDSLDDILKGKGVFHLIDEQKVAYELVRAVVKTCHEDNRKHVIFVTGGPGTGKSIIATHLLADAINHGHNACYVTKNQAPRDYFVQVLRGKNNKKAYISSLFKGASSLYGARENEYDLVVVDEAHRLEERDRYHSKEKYCHSESIIAASRVTVFFVDEGQIVAFPDKGTIENLERSARNMGAIIHKGEDFALKSQFRCQGGNIYPSFVENILGINKNGASSLKESDYDFRIYDDLVKMRDDLRVKNQHHTCRMVAGYCYEWVSKDKGLKSPEDDINIGNFHAKWNLNVQKFKKVFALDPGSFDLVGCIHTVQGLEFDYIGVIIGKDLYYEDGKVKTNFMVHPSGPDGDKSFYGLFNHQDDAKADRLVRNIYRVLMTRGQKGCFVYCEDPALRDYIRNRIGR